MKSHIYDLERGEITDLDKFLKKPHSAVLSSYNVTIPTLAICFFSLFLNAKPPIFAVDFFEKPPELIKDPKWPPIAK